VTNKPVSDSPGTAPPSAGETERQRFERVLSRAEFNPLKAVIDNLRLDGAAMHAAALAADSYQLFLGRLGYRVAVVQHLHEQDCYSRLGPKGGIRAVIPLHDTTTYSTLVTLVNLDSTVTTTPNSVAFYDRQLAQFKVQLKKESGTLG
jgi:hypothetical protein